MWRCACAVALLCAALADTFEHAEMSASPFVLSSRYGRSSPRMLAPRNDRFFLTGRYGKRSGSLDGSDRTAHETIQDDRDGQMGKSTMKDGDGRSVHRNWRTRCDCAPYAEAYSLSSYYKRLPAVLDASLERR